MAKVKKLNLGPYLTEKFIAPKAAEPRYPGHLLRTTHDE